MLVKKLFKRHYREIRAALKEDLEGWSEIPSGPFNTDPILEPRLEYLSRNPEGWIEDSETRDGIRFAGAIHGWRHLPSAGFL